MKKHIIDLFKDEQNQKIINRVFVAFLFAIFTFHLIQGAIYYLPDNSLFFYSSNVFENFVCLTIAFILYYKIFKSPYIWLKVLGIFLPLIIFIGIAIIKMNRKNAAFDKRVFDDFTSYIGVTFIFIALFYLFNNLNLFLNNSYVKIREALVESEQQLLRQRFNPHFLYNAFNSLYSMSLKNNPKTSESILKLSSMMRYLTDNSNAALSFVKTEIKFINDYIEIEKVRFGSNANITFDHKDLPQDILLQPLLLVPLVENAFKHGFYTNDDTNFVSITAEVINQEFQFSVVNKINEVQHFKDQNRKGKGLDNLRKRLNLSYKNKYSLIIKEENTLFRAVLKIDLNEKI